MVKSLRHSRIRLIAWIAGCALVCLASPTLAQYDNGGWQIMQESELAGFLWTPLRPVGACESKQIWYLLPNYRYPGLDQPIETVLTPVSEVIFEDERSFRRAMEEQFPGGHFVLSISVEEREECW